MKKRLAAFTIIEITVVLLISSIVISFSFISYQIITEQFIRYRKNGAQLMEQISLHSWLQYDISRAAVVRSGPGQLLCHMGNDSEIRYHFRENDVLRHMEARIDTFKVKTSGLVFGFKSKNNLIGGSLVDDVQYTVIDKNIERPYQYTKRYGAAELMASSESL